MESTATSWGMPGVAEVTSALDREGVQVDLTSWGSCLCRFGVEPEGLCGLFGDGAGSTEVSAPLEVHDRTSSHSPEDAVGSTGDLGPSSDEGLLHGADALALLTEDRISRRSDRGRGGLRCSGRIDLTQRTGCGLVDSAGRLQRASALELLECIGGDRTEDAVCATSHRDTRGHQLALEFSDQLTVRTGRQALEGQAITGWRGRVPTERSGGVRIDGASHIEAAVGLEQAHCIGGGRTIDPISAAEEGQSGIEEGLLCRYNARAGITDAESRKIIIRSLCRRAVVRSGLSSAIRCGGARREVLDGVGIECTAHRDAATFLVRAESGSGQRAEDSIHGTDVDTDVGQGLLERRDGRTGSALGQAEHRRSHRTAPGEQRSAGGIIQRAGRHEPTAQLELPKSLGGHGAELAIGAPDDIDASVDEGLLQATNLIALAPDCQSRRSGDHGRLGSRNGHRRGAHQSARSHDGGDKAELACATGATQGGGGVDIDLGLLLILAHNR